MHYSRIEFNVPKHIIRHVRSSHQSNMQLMLILFCVELQLIKEKFYRMNANDTPIIPSGGSSTPEDHHLLGKRSREGEEDVESSGQEVVPYRNFECDDCHASFAQSQALTEHMKSCLPEKADGRGINNPQSPLRLPSMASVIGPSVGVGNGDQVVASEDIWDVKEKFGLTKKGTEKGQEDDQARSEKVNENEMVDHVLEVQPPPPPPPVVDHVLEVQAPPPPPVDHVPEVHAPPPPVDHELEVQAPPPPVGRGVDVDLNFPPPEDCEMVDLVLEAEAPPPLVDHVFEVQAPLPPVGRGVDVDLNLPPPEDY